MANFKRKKPRTRVRTKRPSKHGSTTYWLNSWPKWWDIVFHNRPKRAKNKQLIRQIKKGQDPDNTVFSDHPHKPHVYYW